MSKTNIEPNNFVLMISGVGGAEGQNCTIEILDEEFPPDGIPGELLGVAKSRDGIATHRGAGNTFKVMTFQAFKEMVRSEIA